MAAAASPGKPQEVTWSSAHAHVASAPTHRFFCRRSARRFKPASTLLTRFRRVHSNEACFDQRQQHHHA